jgi:D-alanine transaminase
VARVVYIDGRYKPWSEAFVHAEDRGYQFGDAVYEVCEVRHGHLIDETRHLDRLTRSLAELAIAEPMSRGAWQRVLRETVRRNRVENGLVYLQVSRGVRRRDFLFPGSDVTPTVVCLARAVSPAKAAAQAETGIAVKTVPDTRWARCDIKTVMLLPASLAKEQARAAGAQEAWFVDVGGMVVEGGSTTAWIVDRDGRCITRPLGPELLPGITRRTLLDVLEKEGLQLVERPFSVAEALAAREAFVTSATSIVMPVVRIDGQPISNGAPGTVARHLRAVFHGVAEARAVAPAASEDR